MFPTRFLVLAVIISCLLTWSSEAEEITPALAQDIQLLIAKVNDLQKDVSTLQSKATDNNQWVEEKMEQLQKRLFKNDDAQDDPKIEERLRLLESQMADVNGDIKNMDEEVNFLLDEQVLQDERLVDLEGENEDLQITSVYMDNRVSDLEKHDGGAVNSSGGGNYHDGWFTRLENTIDQQGQSLTFVEADIKDLRLANTSLGRRVQALEREHTDKENVAFHAVLTFYLSVPKRSPLRFNEVLLNVGNGYNVADGVFTVPPGGEGLYYFSTYLTFRAGRWGSMQITKNRSTQLCTVWGDNQQSDDDHKQSSCSAIVSLVPGDTVRVVHSDGETSTPLIATRNYFNGFNGYRI